MHTNLIRSVKEGWGLLASCSRDSKCTRKSQIRGGKMGLPPSLLLALSEYIQWFPLAAWTQNFILVLIFLFLILAYLRFPSGGKIRMSMLLFFIILSTSKEFCEHPTSTASELCTSFWWSVSRSTEQGAFTALTEKGGRARVRCRSQCHLHLPITEYLRWLT